MSELDRTFAWYGNLRHQGLLISPAVLLEYFPPAGRPATAYEYERLRDRYNRFLAQIDSNGEGGALPVEPVRAWIDALMTGPLGHAPERWWKQDRLDAWAVKLPTGERHRPHRALMGSDSKPVLLLWFDEARRLGIGRSKNQYARFLSVLRGAGVKLGLFTNGLQFRLCYAGLDHDAWIEWEAEAWFAGAETRDQLHGFLSLLGQDGFAPRGSYTFPLLEAVEASRTRQGELAQVLGEQVRQAVERLMDGLPSALERRPELAASLTGNSGLPLSEAEQWRALYQGATRLIMRLVVVLYAETRDLLPRSNAFYHQSYSVEQLFANLQDSARQEPTEMRERKGAWKQLLSLFQLIHQGSAHPDLPVPAYGGHLFVSGDPEHEDPVRRALALFEADEYDLNDYDVYEVLRLLKIGKLRVRRGRGYKLMTGPVDFSDLRTEYIGIMYQGLLDYELRRVGDDPMVVLGIGSEPVLPLSLLEGLDDRGLKDLISKLGKVDKSASHEDEEDEAEEAAPAEEAAAALMEETEEEAEAESEEEAPQQTHQQRALAWGLRAVEIAGLIKKPKRGAELLYEKARAKAASSLVKVALEPGSFYLVRWGGTRKGSGTFYTRPQLSVPLTHRTLEPLCYEKLNDASLMPKRPEEILALKVCDPAMGSGSFLVAALNYLTDALLASLQAHDRLKVQGEETAVMLLGGPASGREADELIPCRQEDPRFEELLRARLKRHVVERCIYGVDLNPLAVELARVSLWVETMDRSLPFEFLDHKLKVGNSLVGTWLHRFEDYPGLAWARDAGDKQHEGVRFKKGEGTKRLKEIFQQQVLPELFETVMIRALADNWAITSVETLRDRFARMRQIQRNETEREEFYRREIVGSEEYRHLRAAMDRWCAIWFWPIDGSVLPLTPRRFDEPTTEIDATVNRLREQYRFFHWELEYPEVFVVDTPGFSAVLGNPPWDIQKPNSLEFFAQFDPIYRTYGKQEALQQQRRIFQDYAEAEQGWITHLARFRSLSNWVANAADPFDVPLGRQAQAEQLARHWKMIRAQRPHLVPAEVPYRYQGGADLNTYKLFTEMSHYLMRTGGRMGLLLPSGIYGDKGAGELRRLLTEQGKWERLVSMVNERFIFEGVDHRFRFCAILAERGYKGDELKAIFRITVQDAPRLEEVASLLDGEPVGVMPIGVAWLKRFGGPDLQIPSFRGPEDKEIFDAMWAVRETVGDALKRYPTVTFSNEFHMTGDSHLFVPRSRLQSTGLLSNDDDTRDPRVRARLLVHGFLPLYEGKHIWHFDALFSGDHQRFVRVDDKRLVTWRQVVWRDISSATNSRTLITSVVGAATYGNTLWTIDGLPAEFTTLLSVILNSFAMDFIVRATMSGHVTLSVFTSLPWPRVPESGPVRERLLRYGSLLNTPGAMSNDERLRVRCLADALVAYLYGLSPEQFTYLVGAFPAFDKRLPSDLRFPSLAAACYRDLARSGYDWLSLDSWQLPGEAKGLERWTTDQWTPSGGWEQAWDEARAMLSDIQWAMLRGEHQPSPAVLAEVAASRQPGGHGNHAKTKSKGKRSGSIQTKLFD
ncbi:MAG: Eco57I restriction-modification methylase domain-containing protein [Bacillota bacterium]